nr:MAG TPA: hypothetical protein [Caudoviricetes sp.]
MPSNPGVRLTRNTTSHTTLAGLRLLLCNIRKDYQ